MKKKKTKTKSVVSFALDDDVKAELEKKERHTVFVAAVVTASLGRCPVCQGEWPQATSETPTVDG